MTIYNVNREVEIACVQQFVYLGEHEDFNGADEAAPMFTHWIFTAEGLAKFVERVQAALEVAK